MSTYGQPALFSSHRLPRIAIYCRNRQPGRVNERREASERNGLGNLSSVRALATSKHSRTSQGMLRSCVSKAGIHSGSIAAGRLPYLLQPRRQGPGILPRRPPCIAPPSRFRFYGIQRPDRRLAVVTQQFNRRIDDLPAMLGPCSWVALSQLPQHLRSRPRSHRFVHVGYSTSIFVETTRSGLRPQPIAGRKYFGWIRGKRLSGG